MDINTFSWIFVPSFIFGEFLWKRLRHRASPATALPYPTRDLVINFTIGFIDRLFTKFLWAVIMFAAFTLVYEQVTPLRVDMSQWWAWPLAILLSDFAFYWYHRAGHEIRLFWAIHNVHHSSQHYNFSTSIRLSWLEGFFRWPFWLILPLAGFSPIVSSVAYMVIRLYQVTLHTENVGKLGWLENILCTPSQHRVHHGRNPQYLDKNYGGLTSLWDRVFGTHAVEDEKVEYGLVTQLESKNLLWINAHEFVSIVRDVRRTPVWRDRFSYVFGRPGWAPRDCGRGGSSASLETESA